MVFSQSSLRPCSKTQRFRGQGTWGTECWLHEAIPVGLHQSCGPGSDLPALLAPGPCWSCSSAGDTVIHLLTTALQLPPLQTILDAHSKECYLLQPMPATTATRLGAHRLSIMSASEENMGFPHYMVTELSSSVTETSQHYIFFKQFSWVSKQILQSIYLFSFSPSVPSDSPKGENMLTVHLTN